MKYTEFGAAAPFKIDGYEAKSDVLQFAWHNSSAESLAFIEGSYEIIFHIWTTNGTKPNISITERFDISKELAEIMQKRRGYRG